MGQGIILMVSVTSIQKWDTGFSGGILNFESWYDGIPVGYREKI
jgi:hypothetical protein